MEDEEGIQRCSLVIPITNIVQFWRLTLRLFCNESSGVDVTDTWVRGQTSEPKIQIHVKVSLETEGKCHREEWRVVAQATRTQWGGGG